MGIMNGGLVATRPRTESEVRRYSKLILSCYVFIEQALTKVKEEEFECSESNQSSLESSVSNSGEESYVSLSVEDVGDSGMNLNEMRVHENKPHFQIIKQ